MTQGDSLLGWVKNFSEPLVYIILNYLSNRNKSRISTKIIFILSILKKSWVCMWVCINLECSEAEKIIILYESTITEK